MRHFQPKNINFGKLAHRYKHDPSDELKKNSDVRLGFKLKNTYLVKTFFTFGLRTVQRGTAHVIQTLNVPLVMYVHPNNRRVGRLCRGEERIFPFDDLHLYDLGILPPNGVYRIPPGVKYLVMTTQKNFFGIDVVPESMSIPFRYTDPVLHRITRLPGICYDRPPRTPYIEHVDEIVFEPVTPELPPNNNRRADEIVFEPVTPEPPPNNNRRADEIIFEPVTPEPPPNNQREIFAFIEPPNNQRETFAFVEPHNNQRETFAFVEPHNNQQAAASSTMDTSIYPKQENLTFWVVPPQHEPRSDGFAERYQRIKNCKIEESLEMMNERLPKNDSDVPPLDLTVSSGTTTAAADGPGNVAERPFFASEPLDLTSYRSEETTSDERRVDNSETTSDERRVGVFNNEMMEDWRDVLPPIEENEQVDGIIKELFQNVNVQELLQSITSDVENC